MENDLISRADAIETIRSMTITIGGNNVFPDNVKSSVLDALEFAPSVEAEPVRHGRWVKTRKHVWKKDEDGEIDEWAWDYEVHNGVSCEICHKSPCIHCKPDYDEKQDCREHYTCSECGRVVLDLEPYCHCGAKMDAKACT